MPTEGAKLKICDGLSQVAISNNPVRGHRKRVSCGGFAHFYSFGVKKRATKTITFQMLMVVVRILQVAKLRFIPEALQWARFTPRFTLTDKLRRVAPKIDNLM